MIAVAQTHSRCNRLPPPPRGIYITADTTEAEISEASWGLMREAVLKELRARSLALLTKYPGILKAGGFTAQNYPELRWRDLAPSMAEVQMGFNLATLDYANGNRSNDLL